MVEFNEDQPLYTIGVVAELLDVHPETLRVWERNGLINPARNNKQRLYSNNDLKRLQFINGLIVNKGLNLAGVRQVLQLYPCWRLKNCRGGKALNVKDQENYAKPCWKQEGSYCIGIEDKADFCNSCAYCQHHSEEIGCTEGKTN